MSVFDMRTAKSLKMHGERLGRDGLSERAMQIMDDFAKARGMREAMKVAGRMKALAAAAKFDDYWTEQVDKGFSAEVAKIMTIQK